MKFHRIFDSAVKEKIAYFFHSNPTTIDTIRGIVTWTGLNRKEVISALEDLVRAGILVAHRSTSTVGYAYTASKALINKIKKYFQQKALTDDRCLYTKTKG